MINGERLKVRQKAVRWPCGVCSKGVGSSSIQCTTCQKWVHKQYSEIKGSMSKVMKSFICRGCFNPVTSDWVKKCMEYKVKGPRPRGRPKRTWREVVEKDCHARKLNKEDAMDCSKWRKLIKDVR